MSITSVIVTNSDAPSDDEQVVEMEDDGAAEKTAAKEK